MASTPLGPLVGTGNDPRDRSDHELWDSSLLWPLVLAVALIVRLAMGADSLAGFLFALVRWAVAISFMTWVLFVWGKVLTVART